MAAQLNNIPILDGWVNLTEAAEMIGITRQHAHKKARLANEGKPNGWKTIHRVGSKPMYVVSTHEIEEIHASVKTSNAGRDVVETDLLLGTLAPQDREAWLARHRMRSEDWPDYKILTAMGSGIN